VTFFRRLLARLALWMAWVSGLLFLLLAFYMTADGLSRTLGGPFTGVSDQIAAMVLALGATWALALGVNAGTHVRSDVVLPLLPRAARRVFDIFALFGLASLGWLLAYAFYVMTMESYDIGAMLPQSIIEMQLYIPQAVSTFGMLIFALTATVALLDAFLAARVGVRGSTYSQGQ
jgi:TRAP-type C4-dicarboxylate transport system permease small subunit